MRNSVEPDADHGRRRPTNVIVTFVAMMAMVAGLLVGSSAPVAAQEPPPPGTLTFINGFDAARFTAVVDPTATSRQELDVKELRTLSPIELAPGSHSVEIYAGQSADGAPLATRDLTIESGGATSFVVHPGASGDVVTSVFTDDARLTGSDTTRLVVRHVGEAGAVDVELRPSPEVPDSVSATTDSFTLTNGQQATVTEVIAAENVLYELVVSAAGSSSPLIIDNDVTFTPGEVTTIYVAGNPPTAETSSDPASLLQTTTEVGALAPPKVNLVNGFSTGQYVFYVDGSQAGSIEALRQNGLLQGLTEGTVTVEAYSNSGTPGSGTPDASLDIKVCDGRSYDLAIHADAAGNETLTLFENDVTELATGTTRFTVRHIAEYGPLDVIFRGSGENPGQPATSANFPLSNGDERIIDDALINDYLIRAVNPGTTAGAVAENPDFEGEGGDTQIAYIMGTPPGETPPLMRYLPYSTERVVPGASAPGTGCQNESSGGDGGPTTPAPGEPSDPPTPSQDVIGSSFTSITPERILDTRESDLGHAGIVGAGQSITVPVAGQAGIPTSGVTAVSVNLTVTETAMPGYLSARPTAPSEPPPTSNLNYSGIGQDRAAMATVPLAADGSFSIYAHGTTHIVADVLGYFTAEDTAVSAGRFIPLSPERLFDTREPGDLVGKLAPDTTYAIQAGGEANVPSSGVDALVMNLTATEPEANGFLQATASGAASGSTSSLNFLSSDIAVANQIVVPLDADGQFSLSAHVPVHALADVVGYFTDDTSIESGTGLFEPITPQRVLDSRFGLAKSGKVSLTSVVDLDVVGPLSVSADEVSAVAMTVTAIEADAPAWVRVSPEPSTQLTSTLNLEPGDVRANAVYSGIQSDGTVSIVALNPVNVIADISGYFTS